MDSKKEKGDDSEDSLLGKNRIAQGRANTLVGSIAFQ